MTLDLVDMPTAALAQNTLFSRDNARPQRPPISARMRAVGTTSRHQRVTLLSAKFRNGYEQNSSGSESVGY